jgi:predicted Ser/Thr protein kinase
MTTKEFKLPENLVEFDEKVDLDKFISTIESRPKTDVDLFSELWEYNPNQETKGVGIRSRCYKVVSPETCIYLSKGVKVVDISDPRKFIQNEVFITALMGQVGIGPKVYDYSFDEFTVSDTRIVFKKYKVAFF